MFNRRQMLVSTAGFTGYAMAHGRAAGFVRALKATTKRAIILWMDGGPSQLETFDPKPGTTTGGPTTALGTDVDDLQISSHLPRIAELANDLNVIRSLTSNEGDHQRAKYLGHTGFKPIAAFPRPELGSLFAHQLHEGALPGFISLGSTGYGPAYLGEEFAPFSIEDPDSTVRLLKRLRSGKRRFELLDALTDEFDQRLDIGPIARRKATLQRVEGLLDTDLTELLDVETAGNEAAEYGESPFARSLLTARRLIEGGVTCVEVQLRGWDTHQNNFRAVGELCRQLDGPWAQLIEDLKARDLWDETLVIWMGDFGRTPVINAQLGRDHFPAVSNVVLSGGGLPGGQVIGRTNSTGSRIEDQPVKTADLFATILHRIGISPDESYQTKFDSPTEATDSGNVIPQLA